MPSAKEKIIRMRLPDHTELTCLWVRGGVKHINLRMHPDGTLRVSSPQRVTEAQLRNLLAEKMDFIASARERLRRAAEEKANAAQTLEDGGTVQILGVPYTVRRMAKSCPVALDDRNKMLILSGDTPEERQAQLEALLLRAAPARLTPMFRALNRRFRTLPGFPAQDIPVRFRRMKSRWGSCRVDPAGTDYAITLNSRLLLYPPACAEYVMVHELAHILQPDHSPAFYAVVASVMPDWQERRALLRTAC